VTPLQHGIAARLPRASLAPLVRRLDHVGVMEHARGPVPSAEYGHCTDDAGRALGLAVMLDGDPDAEVVASACLRQLDRSLCQGDFWLRLGSDGRPSDEPSSSDDATARALWGLGLAAVDTHREVSGPAKQLLDRTADFESAHPRAAAQAVIAGTVMLTCDATSRKGRRLIDANLAHIPRSPVFGWRWPEPRMTYGNAMLAESLLHAGHAIDDVDMVDDALDLLAWLTDLEWSPSGHFSFTPVHGRNPGDPSGFDQQPIEAWTLATACRAALDATHDPHWYEALGWLAAWFEGANDHGVRMWDVRTGAAFDGLTASGVNENQGAESTLAMIGTLHAYESATLASAVGYGRRSNSRR
jgi:hypothetical protein